MGGIALLRRWRAVQLAAQAVAARAVQLAALAVAAVAVAGLHPDLAEAGTYVAMGDSYASGVGTRSYYAGSGSCRRSPYAYPVTVASRIGRSLEFVACSGARTTDVLDDQVGALDATTRRVTISIGGNDAGFGRVVAACARPWPWTCWAEIEAAERYIRQTLPWRLDRVYRAIDRRSPRARVAVVGYPRIFNGRDTCDVARISTAEQHELNAAGRLLGDVTRARANSHGFAYVNPIPLFRGHAICEPSPWIAGLAFPLVESYHPNRAGHEAYANLVTPAID